MTDAPRPLSRWQRSDLRHRATRLTQTVTWSGSRYLSGLPGLLASHQSAAARAAELTEALENLSLQDDPSPWVATIMAERQVAEVLATRTLRKLHARLGDEATEIALALVEDNPGPYPIPLDVRCTRAVDAAALLTGGAL